uniref:nuclear transport factor 2 family protein n=1 Tax=Aminobacter niigataensis TaxID=83265 RepID=UPI002852B794|nr:nuclear transport factor 2 family protein [Aminobacter niigataensis]WMD00124.1 nuclear transport factor 2 family protein [Aminobacter niigataensis]
MYEAMRDVTEVVVGYFRLMNSFDVEKFYDVFHKEARLYGYRDNAAIVWSAAEYREILAGREAPAARGEQPNGDIFSLSLISDHQAVAVVKVSMSGTRFRDVLTLFRDADTWRVVSKTFTVEV